MVIRTSYLGSILEQIRESYNTIYALQNKPGDLAIMRIELHKARGIMQVIVNKINPKDFPSIDITGLISRCSHFIEDYSFDREIDIMEPLYGEDPGRLHHMRLKIIEAFQDNSIPAKLDELLEDL